MVGCQGEHTCFVGCIKPEKKREEDNFWGILHILFAALTCPFHTSSYKLLTPKYYLCTKQATRSLLSLLTNALSFKLLVCVLSSTAVPRTGTSRHTWPSLHAKHCAIQPKTADMPPNSANKQYFSEKVVNEVNSETSCHHHNRKNTLTSVCQSEQGILFPIKRRGSWMNKPSIKPFHNFLATLLHILETAVYFLSISYWQQELFAVGRLF